MSKEYLTLNSIKTKTLEASKPIKAMEGAGRGLQLVSIFPTPDIQSISHAPDIRMEGQQGKGVSKDLSRLLGTLLRKSGNYSENTDQLITNLEEIAERYGLGSDEYREALAKVENSTTNDLLNRLL